MRQQLSAIVLALAGLITLPTVHAQAPASQVAPVAPMDRQQAQARYKQDLQICDSETQADARMQCKRDAKAGYDKVLADNKLASPATDASKHASTPGCADCGTVTSVREEDRQGEGSAVGLIAGGVAGAVLGHQVGGGFGKDLATVAGAAGGAYAGRAIEKRVKSHKVWVVSVRFPDQSSHQYEFQNDPGFSVGQSVRKSNQTIVHHP